MCRGDHQRVRYFVSAIALTLLSAAAFAEDSAADWLVRMSNAAHGANYQGVVVYRDEDMFETLSLVHRNLDGKERERLASLTGEPREILRQDDHVTCLLPKQRRLTADRPGFRGLFPRMSQESVQKLIEHYDLRVAGSARVAGRVCRGVHIVPKDKYRYGYEFWADEVTAVPLKVTLTAPDKPMVEELVFTQVEFPNTIPDTAFNQDGTAAGEKHSKKESGPATPAADAAELPASRWDLRKLPDGFQITMRSWRELPGHNGNIEHVLVSDGLSAVSVFMASQSAPDRSSQGFSGFSHMGAVHAYGRMVDGFHIAVVGEVPAETVRLIGDGLKQLGNAQAASPSSQ